MEAQAMTILLAILGLALGIQVMLRLLHPLYCRWGATAFETRLAIPGVEYLKDAPVTSTHAITIDAPAFEIWPWLVQMGSGRGGCYSYTWLENLVGCRMKNADRILPQFQNLKEGEGILLHPKAPPLTVTRLEEDRVLALEGWVFYLKPLARNQTRLLTRTYAVAPKKEGGLAARIVDFATRTVWFDLAHFIMGRKQLIELKRRVEDAALR
jgi:hypothetical protein